MMVCTKIENICPQCQETLIQVNLQQGGMDVYCENCGWPDENRPPNPNCGICGKPGVGICNTHWRCEAHWTQN